MNMILNFKKARKKEQQAFDDGKIVGEQYAYYRITALLYAELKEANLAYKEAKTPGKKSAAGLVVAKINYLLMKVKGLYEQANK